jgi:SAM-dependent methyltransferase
MHNRVGRYLPTWMKALLRALFFLPADLMDTISRRREEMIPPRRLIFVGDGDFVERGNEFVGYFREFGLITQESRVLDIGCGIGRMARPLTLILQNGFYEGFDIVPKGIDWCLNNISSRFSNFHFQQADIYNKAYNPKGRLKAQEYIFPFKSESFDFAFMTSVCTHLLPEDMEHYLAETSRVLRSGGKIFTTYFLLNHESIALSKSGRSALDFKFQGAWYHTIDNLKPESATAFEESFVRELYSKYRLKIVEPIQYGSWCGRNKYLSYQDVVIATKVS